MAPQIHLHIGVMKSATSYLQDLCETNRDVLAEQGLRYVPEALRYDAIRDLLGKKGPRTSAGAWTSAEDLVRRHAGDVLWSNELLAGLAGPRVRRVLQALPERPRHLVITARDLSKVIPSHWQTTVKNGRTWTWSQFATDVCRGDEGDAGEATRWFWRRHDIPQVVRRWTGVDPTIRVTIVTVPPDSADLTEVVARFGSAVGVDLTALEQPSLRRNASLGARAAELMRRLNDGIDAADADADHRYRRALGGVLAEGRDGEPSFALNRTQYDWVRRRAADMVDELRQLEVGVVGELADLVPAEAAMTESVDPESSTDADLLAAAMRGLAGLAGTFDDLGGVGGVGGVGAGDEGDEAVADD